MWFSNTLHLVVEEGRSHLVTIETLLSEYQLASTTVHVVTLQEYELLVNDSTLRCSLAPTDLLRTHFNDTGLSFQDLDPAEGGRAYDVEFICY